MDKQIFVIVYHASGRERYEDSLQLTAIEYTSLSTLDDKLTVPAGVALYEKDDTDLAAAAASKINNFIEMRGTMKMKTFVLSVFMFRGNSFFSNQPAVPDQ